MTIVDKISQIRELGVFHDFKWPNDLPTFSRYNLIYGWNGTGKTSISRILRSLELQTNLLPPAQAELRIKEVAVKNSDFASNTTPIRVFNRDFVDEAIFQSEGGSMPPIFVIGEKSARKQESLNQLKAQLKEVKNHLQNHLSKEVERAQKDMNNFCINRAKLIKNNLRSNVHNPYNDYDKSKFRDRIEQMVNDGDGNIHELSDVEHERVNTRLQAKPKESLSELAYKIPVLDRLANDAVTLLVSAVTSKTIETLKADHKLSEWMHTGLFLHKDRSVDQCLFCEQPLKDSRLVTLEAHFSAEYDKLAENISAQIHELESAAKQIAECKTKIPNKAEFHEEFDEEYEIAKQSLQKTLTIVHNFFKALIKRLEEKKEQLFKSLELAVSVPLIDNDPVHEFNLVIRKHNQACQNLESRIKEARDKKALHIIASELDEFVQLQKAVRETEGSVSQAEEKADHLAEEIKLLEEKLTEHRLPAEQLNEDLSKYLGHADLRLDVERTGYTIFRGDKSAKRLSEGEKTAIALLYFLKSLQDKSFDLNNGVVVLDDPVSSLDANALYLAFGFIRERTKEAGQLFILTHNFTFFREVRNWFHHQQQACFYMIDCARDNAHRFSKIVQLDPLLKKYESEYHYLFSCIYNEAYKSSSHGLEQNYFLPNMARRVLETFLAFRQPEKSKGLREKLQDVDFDDDKKHRIIRFINTYSHGDTIGEPQHDLSLLGEARSVLQDVLFLIENQDPKHFTAMKKLVQESN